MPYCLHHHHSLIFNEDFQLYLCTSGKNCRVQRTLRTINNEHWAQYNVIIINFDIFAFFINATHSPHFFLFWYSLFNLTERKNARKKTQNYENTKSDHRNNNPKNVCVLTLFTSQVLLDVFILFFF